MVMRWPDDLAAWIREWRQTHVKKQKSAGRLKFAKVEVSDKAIKQYIDVVYAVLNRAITEGHLKPHERPTWRPEWELARRNTFEEEDMEVLQLLLDEWVREVDKKSNAVRFFVRYQFARWFRFMLGTGLRIGEARVLKWRDLSRVNQDDENHPYRMVQVRGVTLSGTRSKSFSRGSPSFVRNTQSSSPVGIPRIS